MPFEVKIESEKLLQQFEDVQKRVTELDQKLPEVFLDWQREDMSATKSSKLLSQRSQTLIPRPP